VAGNTFTVEIDSQDSLWALLGELAQATPPGSWVLVGGAMVQLHSIRAGLGQTRLTRDIDALLDLSRNSIGSIAAPIQSMGFIPQIPSWTGGFHRFKRGDDVIDVMASREVAWSVKWAGHELLKTAGGAQALARSDMYALTDGLNSFTIRIPDSVGAIVAKSAAHLVDRVNRERHLRDLVTLLAACPAGDFVEAELSKKDVKYLRHLSAEIGDELNPWWFGFSAFEISKAKGALGEVRALL
jgi:predicted nucleotidyltransferase